MTITQITRIQHRRGNESDLPQSLGDAELGFTTDTGRLFIGAEYHPIAGQRAVFPYKNIEILTEYSPITIENAKYRNLRRYREDMDDPYETQAKNTEQRDLQDKLDDFVSVKDYGAIGDGYNDDTKAILYAILDVTNPITPPANRFKALYFPAGIYRITRPLFLPRRSIWIGEGISKVQHVADERYPDPGNTVIEFSYDNDNENSLAECVIRTADSSIWDDEQFVEKYSALSDSYNDIDGAGSNIATNYKGMYDLPEDIYIHGINFISKESIDIVQLDRSSRVNFSNCSFESRFSVFDDDGNVVSGIDEDEEYSEDHPILVRIDSLDSDDIKPSDILFDSCTFSNAAYAFYITDDVTNVSIQNSNISNVYRGIELGNTETGGVLTTVADGSGPSNIKLSHSVMSDIQSTGFTINNGKYNSSSFNYYNFDPQDETYYIKFSDSSEFNTSIGDSFSGDVSSKISTGTDKNLFLNSQGRSSEDFTTDEKTKLSGISAGAEVNVQSNWTETNIASDAFIQNKPSLFSGNYNDLTNKPVMTGSIATADDIYVYTTEFITGGNGIDIAANDSDNTITISVTNIPDKELVYGHVDDILKDGNGILLELNSADNTITISRDSLTESDIPDIGTDKITSGTFVTDRLAENGEEGQVLTKTSSSHEWQDLKSVTPPLEKLDDENNITWDVESKPLAYVVLGGDRTLDNPENAQNGGIYTILVQQDSTGSRELSYDTDYGFGNFGEPTLSSDADTYDVLTFMYFDGKMQLQSINRGY